MDAGEADGTESVARVVVDGLTVASAPPAASTGRCCACTTSMAGGRAIWRNAFNSSKASQLNGRHDRQPDPTTRRGFKHPCRDLYASTIGFLLETAPTQKRSTFADTPDTATVRPTHGCHG